MSNVLESLVKSQIKRAHHLYQTGTRLKCLLERPMVSLQTTLTLDRDGETIQCPAYRVQHNNILGEFKGGIRFHHDVTLDECTALASWMTYKTALYGLPFGGGKGGVEINTDTITIEEKEELARQYCFAFSDHIGQGIDIPAPDVGTDSSLMDCMNREILRLTGKTHNFTGKRLEAGGCPGREQATGFGAAMVLKRYIEETGWRMEGATYVLQGYGNVGRYLATTLDRLGMKLIGVGDHRETIHDPEGIDIQALNSHVDQHGTIQGYGGQVISPDRLFHISCDVLVPAALECQITELNAGSLDCKVVLEAANGPTNYEADTILESRSIDVLPDILVNGGGVVTSWYEYRDNLANTGTCEEDVLEDLTQRINETYDSIAELKGDGVKFRDAAYGVALRNLERGL